MTIKTNFRHTCDKCGQVRPAGTLMECKTVIEDDRLQHRYSCVKCKSVEPERRGEFVLSSLRGAYFYR